MNHAILKTPQPNAESLPTMKTYTVLKSPFEQGKRDALAGKETSPRGELFYSVICSGRESSLSYRERKNESQYVEQGFIRGGKTNVFGDFQPAYGVFCSKRDAQRFLKEILAGQHPQISECANERNKLRAQWDSYCDYSHYDPYTDDADDEDDEDDEDFDCIEDLNHLSALPD